MHLFLCLGDLGCDLLEVIFDKLLTVSLRQDPGYATDEPRRRGQLAVEYVVKLSRIDLGREAELPLAAIEGGCCDRSMKFFLQGSHVVTRIAY